MADPARFSPDRFSYDRAFSRNIGWVTEWEQQALRGKRVAIAGMGGVGGVHLTTLARLGIGAFTIADFDRFDIVNFNRQVGATMDTIDRPKAEIMAEVARSINPELRLRVFGGGVTEDNVDDFLAGADMFVDGFDFFVLGIRRRVFARCAELGIPAVTAAPIGMGVGFLAFVPGGMTFEEYFRLEGQPETEQYLRFLMGVAPAGLHRPYLVDPSRIDLAAKRGPSTAAACQLCAGMVATAAVKLLLGRGDVGAAPLHHHFDAYRGKLVITKLPRGNDGPVQRAKLAIARRLYAKAAKPAAPRPAEFVPGSTMERILNVARWAPSGDNVQPWRFRVLDDENLLVRVQGHAADNVYEYREGEPTVLSGGMLLETLRVAATAWGRRMEWEYRRGGAEHLVAVRLTPEEGIDPDPLVPALTLRSVDRRPYLKRRLTAAEKSALAASLGDAWSVTWRESDAERRKFAALGAMATDIRLRMPETFEIHRQVIDWRPGSSRTGIPAAATGLPRPALALMRWAMRDWSRMDRLNRLAGTLTARMQLDHAPGRNSAAFFTLRRREAMPSGEERAPALLRAGADIQRFWLTAQRLGLVLQPGVATLAFAYYGEQSAPFTRDASLRRKAGELARAFRELVGAGPEEVIFLGRIGQPRPGGRGARSSRRPLPELMEDGLAEDGPAPDDTAKPG